ncbi:MULTISPECIES: hypothetical protein [unclassified Lebetimonas]|nr:MULTISPECIES: hypothetical protein [unclassified Lebetimonas]
MTIKKSDKKIVIEGENLYLAGEKLKTRKLFFNLEILNKGEK